MNRWRLHCFSSRQYMSLLLLVFLLAGCGAVTPSLPGTVVKGTHVPCPTTSCTTTSTVVATDTPISGQQVQGVSHTISLQGATYVVTEFPTPNPTSAPLAITRGPDGNLWFTESLFAGATEDGIGRITPGGKIAEFPLPNSNNEPDGITSGSDGNLWFTEGINYNGGTSNNPSRGKIGRITPGGKITEFPLPKANGNPDGITAGSDGNLWFTESLLANGTLQGEIGRITPDGKITEFPLQKNSFPGQITLGVDGNLWFTETVEETSGSKIGRITPDGIITEFPLPDANINLRMITRGPDGNLWFTESVGDGSGNSHGEIGRITPNGKIAQFSIPNSNNYTQGGGGAPYGIQLGPAAITSGPDGNLWFTNLSQSGEIERLTLGGTITKFSLPTARSYGIIQGPDGNLWFTETGANQIGRIAFGK